MNPLKQNHRVVNSSVRQPMKFITTRNRTMLHTTYSAKHRSKERPPTTPPFSLASITCILKDTLGRGGEGEANPHTKGTGEKKAHGEVTTIDHGVSSS